MKADAIREKFLSYFQKQEHVTVPSSSLVPDNDPSVLLTSAGMQQFKPYFLGEKDPQEHFKSRRLVSVQRCFRTSDIESVGDETHLTFFEMLGNFSFGDYSKEGAIRMAWECLTRVFRISKHRLWATIFAGDERVVKDFESFKLWQEHIPPERILEFGRSENWWGPAGASGPCGPSSEIHTDITGNPCERGDRCAPNDGCGRFVELWNLVFMEYFQDERGNFSSLPTKNVDTGMGLERLAMAINNKSSVFDTDLFTPIVKVIEAEKEFAGGDSETERTRRVRVIADHLKGVVFLVADGVRFSNKDQGYILRRIFRRALDQLSHPLVSYPSVVDAVIRAYERGYPLLSAAKATIAQVLDEEAKNYDELLKQKLRRVMSDLEKRETAGADQRSPRRLSAEEAFTLYSTHGLSLERLRREGFSFDANEVRKKIEEHRVKSRAGVVGKFGGHGLGYTLDTAKFKPEYVARVTRMHTATHLLHQALRTVLGNHVRQYGSDISPERLRFDFTHPSKLTPEERTRVEDLVNQQIERNLPVSWKEMDTQEALDVGALSFFRERYPARVKVYTIGDFSKEICGGPHVQRTADVGHFTIVSEKSTGAGIRRIKATVEP